jgi:hypothetical protein
MSSSSPGWYPDPDNSLQKRYWDGSKWTQSTQLDPNGADAWEKKSTYVKSETLLSDEAQRRIQKEQTDRSLGKWVVGIIIALVLIFGFQSCGNHGWRMGVDGNGYQVTCQDGTISMSGGIQGACSHHGGVQ